MAIDIGAHIVGVVKATHATFLGTLLPAAPASVAQTRLAPPRPILGFAASRLVVHPPPGDTSARAGVMAARDLVHADEPQRRVPAADDCCLPIATRLSCPHDETGRGFGQRNWGCRIPKGIGDAASSEEQSR